MTKSFIIAIDGPASSGKSTSAMLVAQKLGYLYIDTGAMYRAITLLAIENKVLNNSDEVIALANASKIDLVYTAGTTKVFLNERDVTEDIRSKEVNKFVSPISKISGVREALVKKQRILAQNNSGIVMEGRDIGSVVFPDADVKIFLTASIEQRTVRRVKEYDSKGIKVSVEEIKSNLESRDKIDSSRENSPLIKAPDAFEVDTSKVTIEQQVEIILEKVRQTAGKKNNG
ncbi:MAG TPA: (d)CMP kinase [Ignavibacteriaceae bacterium]|nr:(d)CMP kinase [Ignavibacteriaceae bacterium]